MTSMPIGTPEEEGLIARKPTGKPTGRPPKEFDQKVFESLCQVWCTWEEMENILQADRNTISGWCKRTYGEPFSAVYKRFSDGGKASLRRNQLQLSKKNATMAIWLGKQKLGQRDIPQELEQFNGKLAILLEKLGKIETSEDFDKKQ